MKPTHFLSIFIFSLILISVFSFSPLPIQAADTGLVTCGLMSGDTVCTICDLITLFQTLVSKANAYFALPLAALMLGYGGFLMVLSGFQGGKASLYEKGKKVLTNAVIGIVIIFCSWLAIDTLLKTIGAYQHADGSSKFGPWHVIECVSPVVKFPKHFACAGDTCKEVDGVGINGCTTDNNSRSCREHFECENNACVLKPTAGFDSCDASNPTSCKPEFCTGVQCADTGINTYEPSNSVDCTIAGDWDTAITEGLRRAGNIGGDVNTLKMIKATMAVESNGRIERVSPAGACGLMQILPSTGQRHASVCGVSPAHLAGTCEFYTNPANAAKSICIGTKIMIALGDSNCGKTVRNIAAGYNGDDACSPSVNCGSAAGPGQCKVGPQQVGETRRWECLWQDNAHTQCNAAIPGGGFSETRKHIPKILGCYNQF